MAKDKKTQEVLEVGVDMRQVLSGMTKMERTTKKTFADIVKAVDEMNKTTTKNNKDAIAGTEELTDSLEDLVGVYKGEAVAIKKVLDNIELLHDAAASANEDERKGIEENIELLKKEGKARVAAIRGKEAKQHRLASSKMTAQAANELGDTMKDALRGVFSKDLKGVVESSAKALVKSLKLTATAGLALKGAGFGMVEKGRARGGAGGAAQVAAGQGAKAIGSVMGGFKPLLDMATKLGPILGLLGSSVMGLLKLFLDLDAKAKDFNREILQSASNTEFLAHTGGDVNMAFDQMDDTLRGIRDAAFSLKNLEWGVSADEFKGMLNVLNQEGVSLHRIGEEASRSGKTVQDFTLDLAHLSVTYSRAFGVPIQEINQLQAEMMRELGMDLGQTKISFQQMTRAAGESGIAANQFFAIIRGVSQDLSLWGTRMEDAVKLLGRLGKVMNPREAQKFMQVAVGGLKNMGRTERLRLTLLTGQGKMSKLLDRDIAHKAAKLGETLGMSGEQLIKEINTKGPAGLEEAVSKLPEEMQGATRSALAQMQLQQKRKGKGVFGIASAAKEMGPAGSLTAMSDALKRFVPGAKKLSDVVGTIGGEMMAENLGISEEQLDQMAKLEMSLDNQKETLKKQLASGDAKQIAVAKKALKKAGIDTEKDGDLSRALDQAGYDQIMDTLDDDTKKTLSEAAKTEDLSKKQTSLQTSMLKQLEMIMDFLMNQLYNILIDLWDVVASIPGVGKGSSRILQKLVYDSKDKDMMQMFKDAAGDMSKFRGSMIGKGGLGKSVSDAIDKYRKASPEEREGALSFDMQRVMTSINMGFKAMDPEEASRKVQETLRAAGVDEAKSVEVASKVLKGMDFSEALKGTVADERLRDESLKKSLWFLDPAALATFIRPKGEDKPVEGAPTEAPETPKAPVTKDTPIPVVPVSDPKAKVAAAPVTPSREGKPETAPVVTAPVKSDVLYSSKVADDNLSLSKEQLDTLHSVDAQMDKFKMDTGFLNGPYSKATENSVLAAVRTALFEYYLYKDVDKTEMLSAMAAGGMSGRSMASAVSQWQLSGGIGDPIEALRPHANGGVVTGIKDGLATVTAAAGEGLTSIGRGERIVPAGKGGDTFQINVSGIGGQDLARFIEAKVIDGVHEYKRRERLS